MQKIERVSTGEQGFVELAQKINELIGENEGLAKIVTDLAVENAKLTKKVESLEKKTKAKGSTKK